MKIRLINTVLNEDSPPLHLAYLAASLKAHGFKDVKIIDHTFHRGNIGKEVKGIITKFTVTKNKVAPPFRGGTIPLVFGKGVDKYRDILEFTTALGVVRRAGSYYRFEEETLGQGVVKAKLYLEEHPETLDKIVKMCYNILGIGLEEEIKVD